ncbi:response regulator transcription factor [Pantoea eucrina]|uniref:Response regulator transcription factor n=1 Tax=Pantoea eucrina TaxID=472693 RepID=A0ABU5LBV6_9GAMM|nr:response regulator transcription factor [Pantoea eucrina]MDZ7277206.1 response regulator transcription factor [Pantoea eucrina]
MFNAKILIVDEHRLVAAGVQALLLMNGFNSVNIVNNINDGIDEVIHNPVDIIIIDPDFEEKNCIAFLRDIVKTKAWMKMIVLSKIDSKSAVIQQFSHCANGFVSKRDPIQALISAIGCVYNNVNYLPEEIIDSRQKFASEQTMLSKLTPRESLILRQLAQGKSNKVIANELGLNNKTVSTHKAKIFNKLGLDNLVEVIELARRNGACTSRHL